LQVEHRLAARRSTLIDFAVVNAQACHASRLPLDALPLDGNAPAASPADWSM
jgi:hypothetical protein